MGRRVTIQVLLALLVALSVVALITSKQPVDQPYLDYVDLTYKSPIVVSADKPAAIVTADEAAAIGSRSVVTIDTGQATGSGFFVKHDSRGWLVVTNQHVVGDSADVTVATGDGVRHPGKVISADPDTDVAVVAADDLSTLQPAPRGDDTAIAMSKPLVAVGLRPRQGSASMPVVTRATVARRRAIGGIIYVVADTLVDSAEAGGPVLDEHGTVVAMATALRDDESPQSGSLAIPASVVFAAVDHPPQLSAPTMTVSGSWDSVAAPPSLAGRAGASGVWTGSEIILWGGRDAGHVFGDGARYDPSTATWKPVSKAGAPAPRVAHAAVWTGREMLVWGGRSAGREPSDFDDGGAYDPATDSWQQLPPAPLSPRAGVSAVWTGKAMLVWGGEALAGGTSRELGDGASYDPATRTWALLSRVKAPSPRTGASATWTGHEMIVWGGVTSDAVTATYLGDGRRYNPATDSWTPVAAQRFVAPRAGHAAVWTPSGLVIWGGRDDTRWFLDGGIYQPATDTWVPISALNQTRPTVRVDAAAVMATSTSSSPGRVLLWGGSGLTDTYSTPVVTSLNDGWLLNLQFQNWTPMPPLPFASRADATALWDGREMFVWGGAHVGRGSDLGSATYLTDGFMYRPPDLGTLGSMPSPPGVTASRVGSFQIDPVNETVYAIDYAARSLLVFKHGQVVAEAPLRHDQLFGLTLSSSRHRLYVSYIDEGTAYLGVFDSDSLKHVASIALPLLADAVVNPAAGRIYVTSLRPSAVWILDETSYNLLATIPIDQFRGAALNTATDQLYVGTGSGAVEIVDGAARRVVGLIPDAGYTDRIVANPASDEAYAYSPTRGTVNVLDMRSRTVKAHTSLPVGSEISVDPTLNRVYIASLQGLLESFDPETGRVLARSGFAPLSSSIGFGPTSHRLFLRGVASHAMTILDGSDLSPLGFVDQVPADLSTSTSQARK